IPLEYFNWRATFVCLAFARPRPMARPPRYAGGPGGAMTTVTIRDDVRRPRAGVVQDNVRLLLPARQLEPAPAVTRALPPRQPEPAQLADLGHPPLGQPVGRHGRWHSFRSGQREHPSGRVEDV